ncbi:spermine oxidase-like [Anneissia japonica]|uniref:spermine oxidase-like n=1 Tax=Anneissia japonica TaxID=1529436 RepID=UPI0014259E06|nr:spermine oxidase-like [Anneissia japonica]
MAKSCPRTSVIVIGSGIAGLSAARKLTQCLPNCKVTILEALSRPGGRINSVEINENEFMEEGATWVHGIEDNPVHSLIKHNQVFNKYHYLIKYKFCKLNGDEVPTEHIKKYKRIYRKIKADAENIYQDGSTLQNGEKSVGEFLQKEFQRKLKDLKLTRECENTASSVFYSNSLIECCICGCNSLYDLVLNDFGEYEELGGGDLRVRGGYSQVIKELLKKLPENCVVYNSTVTEVHWKNDHIPDESSKPVRIVCENGEQFFADHVIATQSLGHLKEYGRALFKPPLPQVKLDIIDRMGYNYITKVHLRYQTPFWQDKFSRVIPLWDISPKDVVTKPSEFTKETWFRHIYDFAVHPFLSNTLEVWLSGESALHVERLENEIISDACTDLLRKFLKDPSVPKPDEILKTSWNTNPYFLGAYSYVAVGSSGEDCDGLAEPLCVENSNSVDVPRVLFAGEATHRTFYSTTHGALLSGEREAGRLISFYQCKFK